MTKPDSATPTQITDQRVFKVPPAMPSPQTLITKELQSLLGQHGLQVEGLPMVRASVQDVLVSRKDAPTWLIIQDQVRLVDVAKSDTCQRAVEDIVARCRVALCLGQPPQTRGRDSV